LLNIFIPEVTSNESFILNENNQSKASLLPLLGSSTSAKLANKKKKIKENKNEITDGSCFN